MGYKERYVQRKEETLKSKTICKENRELFKKFFEFEENKLKRSNGLAVLDESCYKTLDGYITKLTNVNNWFKNKPWKKLTKKDITKIYNDLEDGVIKSKFGKKYMDLISYYDKVFRSKPFELAGKEKITKEVLEIAKRPDPQEVRFVWEDTIRKIINVAIQPKQKGLSWLAYDVGENINSLLRLRKKNFSRQINEFNKSPEYIVNLPKKELKRSRQTRSELTLYNETVEFLDILLRDLNDDDLVFDFEYRQAKKFLDRAVKITGAKCIPNNQPVTWKDFRSSMACRLLKDGWTREEINARLGHKPSSDEIDKYINFLAINRHDPKKKTEETNLRKVTNELEQTKERENLHETRIKFLTGKLKHHDKLFENMLVYFEKKHPEIANEMKKDPEALGQMFEDE